MSCNYADGLSPYENKGKLGLPEIKEDADTVADKARILSEWIRAAKHVVFHTGAGISTAAGIPDFRGPNGVWTLERQGLKPNINTSFDKAEPTKTHMILRTLIEQGYAKFIISQNIDGLHLKSGIKRTHLAELHGNMFVAKCSFCERFTVLSHCAETVGEKPLGLDCPFKKPGGRPCRGRLHDTLLDWEANLPANELETADLHSTLSDLSICLGTTLQIVPAGNLPLRAKKNPNGKLVLINLQSTKHDKKADLIINSKVDTVMEQVAAHLGIEAIPYSAEIDPTKLLQRNMEGQGQRNNSALMDWTIPISSIRQLRNHVKNLPKKVPVKRPKKMPKYSRNPSPPPTVKSPSPVPALETETDKMNFGLTSASGQVQLVCSEGSDQAHVRPHSSNMLQLDRPVKNIEAVEENPEKINSQEIKTEESVREDEITDLQVEAGNPQLELAPQLPHRHSIEESDAATEATNTIDITTSHAYAQSHVS